MVIGLNYSPERIGIGPYTTEMCQDLASHGHDVHVIAAKPYYPEWKVAPGHSRWTWRGERSAGVSITRVPLFVPANPDGAKRLVHYLSFLLAALPVVLGKIVRKRPEMVICVAPSLVSAPLAAVAARLSRCPSVLHVQDLEVGAAFATGLLSKRGVIGRTALQFERAVTGMFDHVSTISPAMISHLAALGLRRDRLILFRNWSDTNTIHPVPSSADYRRRWNIGDRHVALYSGNIGKKQGIEILVDAARHLRHRDDLMFVICGVGPFRAALETRAAGLHNVQFHDLQPTDQLNELLSLATAHLLPQSADAADLVLPSKMVTMLASGRPVVATALPGTGLAVELRGCGLVVPPGNAGAFAAAVASLVDDRPLRDRLSEAARRRAEQVWSKRSVLDAWRARLEHIAARRNGMPFEADQPRKTR